MLNEWESFLFSPWFGAFVAFAATTLGAIPTLFVRNLNKKTQYLFIGLSAGIMLSATCFSLLEPALEMFSTKFSFKFGVIWFISAVLGASYLIYIADLHIPHEHFFKGKEGSLNIQFKQIWLFVIAITIHNIPEGLAIGTSLGSGDASIALPVLIGIAFQDIPEGLIVSLGLLGAGYKQKDAFIVAAITGVVEAMGALFGFYAIQISNNLLPWALAGAGGMMLYVIVHEMIPECHGHKESSYATAGILVGFVLLMCLDIYLR